MSQPAGRGWNLVTVFVVLAVVGGVALMLIPAVNRVRYSAERMQCSNNLKQMMFGVLEYDSTGRPPANESDAPTAKRFPTGCVGRPGDMMPDERLSWLVTLLPYLEQEWLYRQYDLKSGYAGNLPAAQTGRVSLPFLCPEANQPRGDATTHYVAMAGIGAGAAALQAWADGIGFMGYDRPTSAADIKDGLSNTIALMETRSALGPWARGGTATVRGFDPADAPWCGDGRPFGGHSGGTNVAFADGSVKFIRSGIDPKQLAAAITIAGGESVDLD